MNSKHSSQSQNKSEPGKLIVDFYDEDYQIDYYILKNGPIQDDYYQYSIVTDGLGITLAVLVRKLTDFINYQKEIDSVLEHYNFTDYYRKPILVDHVNC